MNRALVTGGAGLVGRFIVEDLLAHGWTVTVAGRTAPPDDFYSRPIAFRPLVLDPQADFSAVLERQHAMVHAAFDHLPGRYRGGEGDDAAGFISSNLDATVALLAAAKAAGVSRAVFLSSRAVYGPHPPGTILHETMPCQPDTLYGTVKLQAEDAIATLAGQDFVPVSLRATGVYGPAGRGQAHKWRALFDDYLAGAPVSPRAGTEVHGDDLAAAVRLVMTTGPDRVAGLAFNVSDICADTRDILAIVQRETGCAHPLPARADKESVNAMDCARLGALGWRSGGWPLFEKTVAALARAHSA